MHFHGKQVLFKVIPWEDWRGNFSSPVSMGVSLQEATGSNRRPQYNASIPRKLKDIHYRSEVYVARTELKGKKIALLDESTLAIHNRLNVVADKEFCCSLGFHFEFHHGTVMDPASGTELVSLDNFTILGDDESTGLDTNYELDEYVLDAHVDKYEE
uniref:Uncharacterized protein n=1 Tax=Amphora coffeiformis TaxID=265554 RepID=A0A6S8J0J1_9STRA